MSLKVQAISGAKWTGVASVVAASVQLIQVIVLAHFLDKKDFGLMAIAVFVIGISQIFIDMGISNSIIHKQEVNARQLSTLYWLNIFMGAVIFMILFLCTPLLVAFYKEPELAGVLTCISITFLIQPFGQQYETLLKKELRFKALSVCDVIAKLTGLLVGLYLAWMRFGVYALVYANLAAVLVSTILLIIAGQTLYKPSFIFSWSSLKNDNFFSFGLFQMGEKLVYYFNSQFDTILIGKLLGLEALGIYNIAKTLAFRPSQIVSPVITKVAFPILAKVQDDLTKLKKAYLKILHFLAVTNAPIYAVMIVFAKPVIQLLFGARWLEATPILQVLSISGFLISIGEPVASLQLARGRADMGFYWNIIMFFFFPVTVWAGHYWGIYGVAIALTLLRIITFTYPVWKFFIYPLCHARAIEYFESFLKPVFWSGIAGALAYFVVPYINNAFLSLLIGGTLFIGIYITLNLLFEKQLILELKSFAGFRKKGPEADSAFYK